MKFRRLLLALFALAGSAAAQFTVVTGTVTDPNGLAYANGTIVATLVTSASPTLSGLPYSPPSGPTQLDGSGKFTIRLGDNSVLLPASTQWTFLICSASGTVQPAGGKGPVCFTVPALTISGSSQSITSNITAVPPPALTNNPGTGTVTSSGSPVAGNIAKFTSATNIAPASVSDLIAQWTGCSGTQYLGADGNCHNAAGGVSSWSGDGTIITNSASTGAITATIAGTSGGIPYFNSATSWASSGALTNNVAILGGGAGSSPKNSLLTDNGTTATYTGTGGIQSTSATSFTAGLSATTAGCYFAFGATGAATKICAVGNGTEWDATFTTFHMPASGTIASGSGNLNIGSGAILNLNPGTALELNPTTRLVSGANTCTQNGTAASPSVVSCSAAIFGLISCATNASGGTCTVNTTGVTANTLFWIQQRKDTVAGTALGVTCNTTNDSASTNPPITAVVAATSFSFGLGTVTTNPECFDFWMIN